MQPTGISVTHDGIDFWVQPGALDPVFVDNYEIALHVSGDRGHTGERDFVGAGR